MLQQLVFIGKNELPFSEGIEINKSDSHTKIYLFLSKKINIFKNFIIPREL